MTGLQGMIQGCRKVEYNSRARGQCTVCVYSPTLGLDNDREYLSAVRGGPFDTWGGGAMVFPS